MTQELWRSSGGSVVGTLTFAYDDAGNLTGASNNDGTSTYTYTMAYDAGNRVSSVNEPFSKTLTFSYDAAGNRTRMQDSGSGVVTSTFNTLNLLSSRQVTGGGATLRADYAYTARHQIGTITRYDTLVGTKVGEGIYAYDDAMRLTTLTHKNGAGTTLASYVFNYDAGSRITSQSIAGTTTTFSYSAADQLTGDGTTTWGYDANGNRNTSGSVPTTGNRLTTAGRKGDAALSGKH